ncbi:ribosomal protein L37AE/L43A [Desulfobaculum xiamenense]|uniref:Ribosomal protein L37AE/L43A n=1 Tax=Desulfobaculum xiamenense TaxID=995050 RepID=A0A846QKG8_9BACT|nr:dual CXXC motif small (seleno)protein [Desulfobaculum xiamenense]NJB66952.1 ribosomal protein L37AE/L43A [Desulfobaculum xiamenense]
MHTPSVFNRSPRQAETKMTCKTCHGSLRVIRSCREVFMFCDKCGGRFPLGEYTEFFDQIEEFMNNVPCDRI